VLDRVGRAGGDGEHAGDAAPPAERKTASVRPGEPAPGSGAQTYIFIEACTRWRLRIRPRSLVAVWKMERTLSGKRGRSAGRYV